ncbi:trypsin-like peptidase domain-containing protein [Streptomyces sp. NPDC001219]
MDDGKAAGPKLKWWSRPGTRPSAETGPQTAPPTGGPADGTPAEGSGTSDVRSDEDWLVRPPERPERPEREAQGGTAGPVDGAGPAGAVAGTEVADAGQAAQATHVTEVADPAEELTAVLPHVRDASAEQPSEDWVVRPPEARNGSASSAPSASPGGAEPVAASGASESAASGDELAVPREVMAADGAHQETAAAVDAPTGGARPAPSTMTLGRVRADTRDETTPPATTTPTPLPPTAPPPTEVPGAAPQQQQKPLHAEDPYGTPPYGGPGPWAPAPPVQRPVATPAQGTLLPPQAGQLAPYGAPAAPQPAMPGAAYPGPPQAPPSAGPPTAPPAAPGAERAPLATGAEHPHPAPAAHPRPAAEPAVPHGIDLQKTGTPQPAPEAAAASGPAGAQHAPLAPAAAPAAGPDAAPDGTDGAFVPHPGDGGPRPASATAHRTAAPQPGTTGPAGHGPGPLPTDHVPADHAQAAAPGHAPQGAWQQYDPWSAPLQGGPVAPPSVRRVRRGPLIAGAVALALLAGGVGGGIGAYVERYGGLSDIMLPQSGAEDGGREPDSVAGIAQTALPGVVTLHVRGSAEQGTGTGFVLDHQGHILTNNHVVEPAGSGGEISVTFSGGQTAKARVIGRDGGYDLAVVQVEGVAGLRPLTLGNSDSVRVGDPVVAIGAPFDLANTVTSGIISAKQRPITAGGQKGDGSDVSYVDALQTDAPINPGNSGGPLVDAKARVIGINSAIRAADGGGGQDGEGQGQGGSIGLGFAIPINQAKRVAEELINTGRATHPVIGVTLEMEYAGDGARVSERSKDGRQPVLPGGPGAKAGIKAGDVITKVDGAPVHSGEELIVKIRSHRPGDTLELTVQRGGKERSVRLSLGSSSTD